MEVAIAVAVEPESPGDAQPRRLKEMQSVICEVDNPLEANDFVCDVFGLCDCGCECLRATWQQLLEHFPEHLPAPGTAQSLRICRRALAVTDEVDRALLFHALARGVGRFNEGDVLLPGLIVRSTANGH